MALIEKAIDDVYHDFFSLTQTLRLLSEDGDSMATGLSQQVGNIKFLSAVYLLHQVLPLLAHLSKVFQAGSVSFAAIGPAINYTLEALETVSKEKRPLSALQKDLCMDGRLSVCDLSSPLAHQEKNLTSLTDRYVKALKKNIKNRFGESDCYANKQHDDQVSNRMACRADALYAFNVSAFFPWNALRC